MPRLLSTLRGIKRSLGLSRWIQHNIHLTRSDVTFVPDITTPQHMEVCIKKSQTDPFWQAARLIIAKSHTIVCAVSAVRDYILQTLDSDPNSFLFQFKDGSPLSWPLTYMPSLIFCGLHSNTHSFRIGAATTGAAAVGVPSRLIKILGHWFCDSLLCI